MEMSGSHQDVRGHKKQIMITKIRQDNKSNFNASTSPKKLTSLGNGFSYRKNKGSRVQGKEIDMKFQIKWMNKG